jgi:hypothetical protein
VKGERKESECEEVDEGNKEIIREYKDMMKKRHMNEYYGYKRINLTVVWVRMQM